MSENVKIKQQVSELKKELNGLILKNSIGDLKDNSKIKKTKKEIARLLTSESRIGRDKNDGSK